MKAFVILGYGLVVSIAEWKFIEFANSLAGLGDGFTVAHRTSNWALVPLALYFLSLTVCGYTSEKNERKTRLFLAHGILLGGLLITAGASNGLFLSIATTIISLPVYLMVMAMSMGGRDEE